MNNDGLRSYTNVEFIQVVFFNFLLAKECSMSYQRQTQYNTHKTLKQIPSVQRFEDKKMTKTQK